MKKNAMGYDCDLNEYSKKIDNYIDENFSLMKTKFEHKIRVIK